MSKRARHLGLKVNRLIRISFGPFQLGELPNGAVKEIESKALRAELGERIVSEAACDFDAPMLDHEPKAQPRSEARGRNPREPRRAEVKGMGRSSFEARRRSRQDEGAAPARSRENKKPRRDRRGGPRPSRPK